MLYISMAPFLFMLLLLSVGGYVDSKPSHNTNGDDPYKIINKKCISVNNVRMVVDRCTRGLRELFATGFPWLPWSPETPKRRRSNSLQHRWEGNSMHPDNNKGGVSDPMDSLNHVCQFFERMSSCMDKHKIPVYCTILSPDHFIAYKALEFLCRNQTRNENLLHSLRCLHDTRLPTMLDYHIAAECRQGFNILDQQMLARKRRYLYMLNSQVPVDIITLYCLPESVLSTCVYNFAKRYCGTMAAKVLLAYVHFQRDNTESALEFLGLPSEFCGTKTSHNIRYRMPTKVGISKSSLYDKHTLDIESSSKAVFDNLLDSYSGDTELDTTIGRGLSSYVKNMSGQELCNITKTLYAYVACVMLGHAIQEIPKFNILQYSHRLIPITYVGSHCSRLGEFTQCWRTLQNLCGSRTRYFAQHATLMIDGCRLQEKMEDISCHWEDFMLPAYIKAARVTRWPIYQQALGNPMFLSDAIYGVNDLQSNFIDFDLLQSAVEAITLRCNREVWAYLRNILNQIRYFQFDAYRFVIDIILRFYI